MAPPLVRYCGMSRYLSSSRPSVAYPRTLTSLKWGYDMRILYSLLLVGVTMVWGWTFVVVQDAIALYGVLGFLSVRFALATAALATYAAHGIPYRSLVVGGGIGLVLALGYLFQTTGLLFT